MNPIGDYYRRLIEEFLGGRISAAEFEATFLERFKNEPEGMPESLYFALDRLFGDVDLFCADDQLRNEDELDEAGLRQACERALATIACL